MKLDSKEVLKGTETTLTCIISGITQAVSVAWYKGGDTPVVNTDAHYGVKAVPYATNTNTQSSLLTVKSAVVQVDTAYTCRVTSGEFSNSLPQDTEASLKIISMFTCHCFYSGIAKQ